MEGADYKNIYKRRFTNSYTCHSFHYGRQHPLNRDVIIQEKALFIIKQKDNYHFPL